MGEKKWITVEEASSVIGMNKDQVYRAIREQQFPFRFVKVGRQIRISAIDLGLVPTTVESAKQPSQASAQAS